MVACSKSGRITAVFSTENNLCNPYRCERTGMPSWVSCDMTYRVASDQRQGFMIIGCGCIGQHFHLTSFAIVNKEDEEAHEHVIRLTRNAVNAAVQARSRAGSRI